MIRDKMTRRRAASQWETESGSGADSKVIASSPPSAGEKLEAMRKRGPRLREPGQVLTNRVAREGEGGRHAPPSNNAGSAYAACGRSGETGPSCEWRLETDVLSRRSGACERSCWAGSEPANVNRTAAPELTRARKPKREWAPPRIPPRGGLCGRHGRVEFSEESRVWKQSGSAVG